MNTQSLKRLLIATLAALALMWLLGFVASLLAGNEGADPVSSTSRIDPLSLLVTSVAMCLGGYLGGKRFIGIALAISAVLWVATVFVLYQAAKPVQDDPLPMILAYNRIQIALSLLAATAGAAIGAWLRMKRPPVPLA